MSVLITAAFQKEWCDFAQDRLGKMGVELPENLTNRDLSILSFINMMFDANQDNMLGAASAMQLKPGQAWEIYASEFILENVNKRLWGWAHPKNLHFLSFWRDFEPSCHFLLVYGSMDYSWASGAGLEEGVQDSFNKGWDLHKRQWYEYHEALLQFYSKNKDRCTLCHIDRLAMGGASLAENLNSKIARSVSVVNEGEAYEVDATLILAARMLGSDNTDCEQLYVDLECMADVASDGGEAMSEMAYRAIQRALDHHKVRLQVEDFARQLDIEKREANNLRQEKDVLWERLNGVQLELMETRKNERDEREFLVAEKEQLFSRLAEQKSDYDRLKDECDGVKSQLIAMGQDLIPPSKIEDNNWQAERELLTAELYEAQEELERVFLRSKKNERGVIASRPAAKVPEVPADGLSSIEVDLRGNIQGMGWFPAEENGRWAGPEVISTLTLSQLDAGTYKVSVEVLDAMSNAQLEGLKLSVNGNFVPSKLEILSNLKGTLAPLRRAKAKLQNIEKPYPAIVVGDFEINSIEAKNSNSTLSIEVPSVISPAASGGDDTRCLSLFIRKVSIHKIS